jgi:hypothetical protein
MARPPKLPNTLAREHCAICLATMDQLDVGRKFERFAMAAPPCGEEADGFPPASVRAGGEATQSRPLGRHKVRAREKNAAGSA